MEAEEVEGEEDNSRIQCRVGCVFSITPLP